MICWYLQVPSRRVQPRVLTKLAQMLDRCVPVLGVAGVTTLTCAAGVPGVGVLSVVPFEDFLPLGLTFLGLALGVGVTVGGVGMMVGKSSER